MIKLFGLGSDPKTFEFRCPDCGQIHRGSPSFALHRPEHFFDVLEAEREQRIQADDDLCIIRPAENNLQGETTYWIRGVLDVPIHGAPEPFCWGVWVSQSKDAFDRYVETFDQDQSEEGSFGWLPVHMKHYHNNDGSWPMLGCDVHWGPIGQRPKLILQKTESKLYIDQRDGISWNEAIAIATPLMHSI